MTAAVSPAAPDFPEPSGAGGSPAGTYVIPPECQTMNCDCSPIPVALSSGDRPQPQGFAPPSRFEPISAPNSGTVGPLLPAFHAPMNLDVCAAASSPRVLAVNPVDFRAWVDADCTLAELNRRLARDGLCLDLDPACETHRSLGGIIADNACRMPTLLGASAADQVEQLDILSYDGIRLRVGPTSEAELSNIIAGGGRRGEIYQGLRDLRDRFAESIRERFPRLPPGLRGYNLDALLPERGCNVAQALVGSRDSCALITRARLRLRRRFPQRRLVILGFPSAFQAADGLTTVLGLQPGSATGDGSPGLVEYRRRAGLHIGERHLLGEGESWLLVEFADQRRERLENRVRGIMEQFRHQPRVSVRQLDTRSQLVGTPTGKPADLQKLGAHPWESPPSRLQAELARRLYGEALLEAFRAFRRIWNPLELTAPVQPPPTRSTAMGSVTTTSPGAPPRRDHGAGEMALRCVVVV